MIGYAFAKLQGEQLHIQTEMSCFETKSSVIFSHVVFHDLDLF